MVAHEHAHAASTLRVTIAFFCLLGVAAACAWWGKSEERALLALPREKRSEIYSREIVALRNLCLSPTAPEAFANRCGDKARFLAEFPDCDQACRTLIQPYLP